MEERRFNENTIVYKIFSSKFCGDEAIASKLLLEVAAKCLTKSTEYTEEYIWQRGTFALAPSFDLEKKHPHLLGKTDFGENIEDEWLIIFILFQLSNLFHDFVISVEDADGEILLIEAADYIPRWLKPETSKNRVFISKGKVHIIPIPKTPAEITLWPTGVPSLDVAINLVSGEANTKACENVQAAIYKRMERFPEQLATLLHHAHCYIPAALAHVINCRPTLVSAAVQAFCERGPEDIKALRNIKHFDAASRILSRIKFTKLLYSQITCQRYLPSPKSYWALPSTEHPYYKAHDLGFKLVCGFEILCYKYAASSAKKTELGGPRWNMYLQYLKKSGYFKGQLEGSRLYKEQLRNAELYFSRFAEEQAGECPFDYYTLSTNGLFELLEEGRNLEKETRKESQFLAPEDDDNWLNLTPEDLDNLLLNTWKQKENPASQEKEYSRKLDDIVCGVKNFVDKVSSHEGAETDHKGEKESLDFDGQKFLNSVRKMLRVADGNDSDVDMECGLLTLESDPDSESSDDSSAESEGIRSTCMDNIQGLDPVMDEIYNSMAAELESTSVQRTFERVQTPKGKGENSAVEDDNVQALDIDVNLLHNFLESFSSQEGLAGPVSSMLQSLGMNLPPREDKGKSDIS